MKNTDYEDEDKKKKTDDSVHIVRLDGGRRQRPMQCLDVWSVQPQTLHINRTHIISSASPGRRLRSATRHVSDRPVRRTLRLSEL
jgi:hypothetical protein